MFPVQVNAGFVTGAGYISGGTALQGYGFYIRPNGMNADLPRTIQLDGVNQTYSACRWWPTKAKRLDIVPAAISRALQLNGGELNEQYEVMVAESAEDLQMPAPAGITFTQALAKQMAVPTAAPTNIITVPAGYSWAMTPSWADSRVIFGSIGGNTFNQWIWSRISGVWTNAGQIAAQNGIEDDLVIVPDGYVYFQASGAGSVMDFYATKRF